MTSTNQPHSGTRKPSQPNKRDPQPQAATSLTLAAMSLGFAVVQLDVTIVNTALGSIGASLGGGVSELQWVVSTYTIAFAALILTAGALGDRIGARRVFMAGFAIFTVASLGCAIAPDATTLIAARAVQGLGASILVPNSLALLNHAYPDDKDRGRAVAIWAAGASLALTAGPLVGGGLIALVGWRAIFLVNLPIGLAGLWLTWRYATETPASPQREIDLPGQIAAVAALGLLAGALIEGGTLGWHNMWVLTGFVGCVVAGALFVARERHTTQPMLPLDLFAHPLFSATALIGLLVNISVYGLIFVFSLYLQQLNGYSPFATGLAFVPMLAAILPLNLIAPRIAERIGPAWTIAAGCGLSMLGCAALLTIGSGTPFTAMVAPFVAIGAGVGLVVPPLTSTLLSSVGKDQSGIAAGVLNATRQTGSVLGVALFGSFLGQRDTFVAGTRLALAISAALLLVAIVVILLAGRRLHARRDVRQSD